MQKISGGEIGGRGQNMKALNDERARRVKAYPARNMVLGFISRFHVTEHGSRVKAYPAENMVQGLMSRFDMRFHISISCNGHTPMAT